ncbi:MAG TPA: hypothetical protein ENF30_02035, partial [Candidatus Desulfofervidus auxilii]|nr:hypothetical protein [Candidatus Desulfofervidus auxilii]
MANYRPIFTKIWDDPHFAELSLEEQHIFLYLLTNSNTTESGIYPISPIIIARNTKVPVEKVKEAFNNPVFQHMVLYDAENKVVFIKKFLKYNARGNPKLLHKAILNDIKNIYTNLWLEFAKLYPEFIEDITGTYPNLSKELDKSLSNVNQDLDNTLQTLTAKPKPKPKPKP